MKSICSVLYCLFTTDINKYLRWRTKFPGPIDLVIKEFPLYIQNILTVFASIVFVYQSSPL